MALLQASHDLATDVSILEYSMELDRIPLVLSHGRNGFLFIVLSSQYLAMVVLILFTYFTFIYHCAF